MYWENTSKKNIVGEKWKYIAGSNVFMISSFGRVKSIRKYKSKTKTTIIKQKIINSGYLTVKLSGFKNNTLVHRLVAKHFVLGEAEGLQVNHINGIKTDNSQNNLSWISPKENISHAIKNNLIKSKEGERNNFCKLSNSQVIEIFNSDLPRKELSKIYNISKNAIGYIKNGKNWSSVTGKYRNA